MKQKVKLNLIIVFILFMTRLQAQEAIIASGGNASGSGGSASYTVGQVSYTTNTGAGETISQGVQQPYEIYVVGIEDVKDIYLECVIYPNPATDFITLKIKNVNVANLNYQLYDMNSKLLQNKKVEGNETSFSMANLEPSTYFLKVTDNNKLIKTFKIIKN